MLAKRQKLSDETAISKSNDTINQDLTISGPSILEGHEGPVFSAKFGQEFIVSGGFDRTINIWKFPAVGDDVNIGCIQGHKAAVTSVEWLGDNIASGSADSSVAIWDGYTGQKIRNFKTAGIVNQVSANGELVVSGDDSGKLSIWDIRQKFPVNHVQTEYPILTVATNGRNLYFSGIDPHVNAYDIRSMDAASWRESCTIDSITSLAVNRDNSMLVARSTRGAVSTFNAKAVVAANVSRSSPYVYDGAPSGNEMKLIRCCFSADSSRLISGSDDKSVTVWDVTSRRVLNKYAGHEASTLDVDVDETGKLMLSTSMDGTIIVRGT